MKYLSIIFVLIFAVSVSAQQKKAIVKPTPTPLPEPVFNSQWQTVPTAFKGYNFANIFNVLSESPVLKEKSEFETTVEYSERISKFGSISIGGGLTASSQLVFIELYKDVARYDADTQVFTILLPTDGFKQTVRENNRTFNKTFLATSAFPSVYKDEGEYTAQNGFGVQTKVKKGRLIIYKVGINNANKLKEFANIGIAGLPFKISNIPAAKAQELKPNLAALFVGKLVYPYFGSETARLEPTLTLPLETTFITCVLIVDISEVWFFNRVTGEIVLKSIAEN
ncbi:hypothetical protein BH10ACI1_BH10ACI1_19360 [soil metagenome]